jgi:hypothetical protein
VLIDQKREQKEQRRDMEGTIQQKEISIPPEKESRPEFIAPKGFKLDLDNISKLGHMGYHD